MRKILIAVMFLILLAGLYGCKEEEEVEVIKETIEVTFINETEDAIDVWVLPDIEANRKTSIWGKAMIEKLAIDAAGPLKAEKQDEGLYLLRVIDADGLYYETNAVKLEDGYTLKLILDSESFNASLEVSDSAGNTEVYETFYAAL